MPILFGAWPEPGVTFGEEGAAGELLLPGDILLPGVMGVVVVLFLVGVVPEPEPGVIGVVVGPVLRGGAVPVPGMGGEAVEGRLDGVV